MESTPFKRRVQKHFDRTVDEPDAQRRKETYYHNILQSCMQSFNLKSKRILILNSRVGDLFAALNPYEKIGAKTSEKKISPVTEIHPYLRFVHGDAEDLKTWSGISGHFDYIVIPPAFGYLEDIHTAFKHLRAFCKPDTSIFILGFDILWKPMLKIAEKMVHGMPIRRANRFSVKELCNILALTGFETVRIDRIPLLHESSPILCYIFKFIGALPIMKRLILCDIITARSSHRKRFVDEKRVSVIIPCRNEQGTIEALVRRLPAFGLNQEIIFVEGHSDDKTLAEIKRVQSAYPHKDIKWFVQPGTGKANAVWTGFDNAEGEILMILDGDLTVPPEDLPIFYHAVASGRGEFIVGCRLTVPMEKHAMRFFNLLGNMFFSRVFSWLLNRPIKDTLCGTKVVSKSHYLLMKKESAHLDKCDPFGDFFLLLGAAKLNLKFVEIPVRYRRRIYGASNISRWRHGWMLLKIVFAAIRDNKLGGKQKPIR